MNHPTLKFRLATSDDAKLLRYWDSLPHIIASKGNEDWQWEAELPKDVAWREFWIAILGEKPIGFLQIIDPAEEETHYWGEIGPGYRALDIWIGEADALNKGYGTEMMRFAIDRCFREKSVHSILVDPMADNEKSHRFYGRLGFEFKEERQFGDDDCHVMELTRDRWENLIRD